MNRILLIIVLSVILVFTGCSADTKTPDQSNEEVISNNKSENAANSNNLSNNKQFDQGLMSSTDEKLGITNENYPKIDGSTSTLPIVRAIHKTMYNNSKNKTILKRYQIQYHPTRCC